MDKMLWGQNGQNGTDEMVWTKCYTDKMVWIKCYGDKMLADKMIGHKKVWDKLKQLIQRKVTL